MVVVEESKPNKGNPTLQYLAAASVTLAIVTDGMHYGWPSNSLPQLTNNETCTLCLTDEQGSWLAVMPLIGDIVGSIIAAAVVDIFGRKKTILATALPFFAAWMMVAYADSALYLYLARFMAGIADGVVFTAIPMYMGEIAEPRIRGLLTSSCSYMWIAGFLLINLIAPYFSIKNTALISSTIPIIMLLTFCWMPESPYHLLRTDRKEEAEDALRAFRKIDDVDDDIYRMTMQLEDEKSSKSGGKFTDLFTVSSNRKAMLIALGLRGFQQLSGTTAIAFYTNDIFKAAGDDISAHHAVMIYFLVQLITTIVSGILVDKAGRKPLLTISMGGAAFALFVEGTYFYMMSKTSINTDSFSFLSVVGLVGFVIMFSIGMQSVPICLLSELFPTNVKGFALCLADVYFSAMATCASQFLQKTRAQYGFYVTFYGFTICSALGLVFIVLFVPETKGKTLEEIQSELKGKKKIDVERL